MKLDKEVFNTPPGSPERVAYALKRMGDGMIKLFDDMKEYSETLPEGKRQEWWEQMSKRMMK